MAKSKRRSGGPAALKRWREAQKPRISQETVGKWIGVGASRVSHYETGIEDLPIRHKVVISQRTGIPILTLASADQRDTIEVAVRLMGDPSIEGAAA